MGFIFEIGPHAPRESPTAPAALPLTIPARHPTSADQASAAAEHESPPAHFERRVTLTSITRR